MTRIERESRQAWRRVHVLGRGARKEFWNLFMTVCAGLLVTFSPIVQPQCGVRPIKTFSIPAKGFLS